VSVDELRGCGLSERKAQYLQVAAQLIVDGNLDFEQLKNLRNPAEFFQSLMQSGELESGLLS